MRTTQDTQPAAPFTMLDVMRIMHSATRAEQKRRDGFGPCYMISAAGVVFEYTIAAPRGTKPAYPQLDLVQLPDGCFARCDLTQAETAVLAPVFRRKARP